MTARTPAELAAYLTQFLPSKQGTADNIHAALAELQARAEQAETLREALDATWDDVAVLLDQHVSSEVEKEARVRLIERYAALAATEEQA